MRKYMPQDSSIPRTGTAWAGPQVWTERMLGDCRISSSLQYPGKQSWENLECTAVHACPLEPLRILGLIDVTAPGTRATGYRSLE